MDHALPFQSHEEKRPAAHQHFSEMTSVYEIIPTESKKPSEGPLQLLSRRQVEARPVRKENSRMLRRYATATLSFSLLAATHACSNMQGITCTASVGIRLC